jgi:cell division protein FtsL
MFEQEIAMEKQQSSVVPLLLIITLIVSLVGVAVYYVIENRKVLASEEAVALVNADLKSQEPATLHIQTGTVTSSVDEKPHDPHYRLLAKGEALLSQIPGVTKTKGANEASQSYSIPLAGRKLVGTPKVTMTAMGHANVEFTWAWDPTPLGEVFDASGPEVQSFNTWDRGTLIDKYEVKFYHGSPARASLACLRGDKGWELAAQ